MIEAFGAVGPIMILLFAGVVLILIYIVVMVGCMALGAPFVPSRPGICRRMVEFADIRPGMKVYDLGCGDGRFLLLAAEKGAEAVGVELDPVVWFYAWIRARRSPYAARIRVRWGSLWWTSVREADVVFVYLMPYWMGKLERMLRAQLKPGAVVVSNTFGLGDAKPFKSDDTAFVYAYRF